MEGKIFSTPSGDIHYWAELCGKSPLTQVFLPGRTGLPPARIPGAGHSSINNKPEEADRLIEGFLEKTKSPAGAAAGRDPGSP